jgi:hypothetical protein
VALLATPLPPPGADGASQRAYQVAVLVRIIDPVLRTGSEGTLRQKLPNQVPDREAYAGLESLGRTLSGCAPWLELGPGDDDEGRLRARYGSLAVRALAQAVDPKSPAHLNFSQGAQPLVDTAFLAQALLRAPRQLWGKLSETERANLVAALKATRSIKPYESNWLLFSAMVEAALLEFTGDCDLTPIEKAVTKHAQWYLGDGTYGDGPHLHWDYYNSFVIHPMLWEILEVCGRHQVRLALDLATEQTRAQRYAVVQERQISPEGSYPVIGRSSVYRFGAFQVLALTALRHQLPAELHPAAVRAGLNAVIHRVIEAPGTFDKEGWLSIGVIGHQPKSAEGYISTGSLYLCTEGLLQLGLPADDPFWTAPGEPWTQQRLWSGEDLPGDHALKD